jgi:hypothetical protein
MSPSHGNGSRGGGEPANQNVLPTWNGRGPELVCGTCSWKYWTIAAIRAGNHCPARPTPRTRCRGTLLLDPEVQR